MQALDNRIKFMRLLLLSMGLERFALAHLGYDIVTRHNADGNLTKESAYSTASATTKRGLRR
jgi:hypothetical protein